MFMVYHDVSKYVGPASTLKRNYSTAGGWFITFDRKFGATPCVDFAPVHFCFGLVACSRGGNLAKTCKNRSRNVAFVLTAWPLLRTNKPSTKSLPGTWRDLIVYTVIWIDDFSSCRPPWKKRKTHTSWFHCCLWAAKQANQFGWEMGSKTKEWKTSPWFNSRLQGHTASSIWQH